MHFLESIHFRAVAVAREFKKSESALIEILMEVDAKQVYRSQNYNSLFQYCVKALKLSEAQTSNLTTVMRACQKVPAVKAALDKGEINLSHARTIASVIQESNQTEWLEKAKDLSCRELEKEVAKVKPEVARPEKIKAVSESKAELRCPISWEVEKKLRRIQDLLSKKKQRSCSLEEAIAFMAETTLEKVDPVRKAERVLSKKASVTWRVPTKPAKAENKNKSGRTAIPAAIAHQVNLRDRGQCRFKLPDGTQCQQQRFTHLHHRVPLEFGGKHSVENLITLCSGHHAGMHP